jgi:hypothetical protein
LVLYLCSHVGPLPHNPARHPAFIKAPRLLGSVPSYLLVLVVATADPYLLSLPRSSILHVPQARHLQCWRYTLSYPCCLPPGECLPKLRCLAGLSFLLSASFRLACEVQEARFHFLLTHSVCVLVVLSPAGRAHQALVLSVLSDVIMSYHESVYWSFCASWRAHRAPEQFVHARSNFC